MRTLESLVRRLELVAGMGQMIVTWFDSFIMGWPQIFGNELEPAMKEKVCNSLHCPCFYCVLLGDNTNRSLADQQASSDRSTMSALNFLLSGKTNGL